MANQKSGMLDAADRDDADDVVRQPVAPAPAIGPQGDAERHGDQPGGDRELHAWRRACPGRPAVTGATATPDQPRSPLRTPAGPVEILHGKRVVQVEALLDLVDLLRGHLV